MMAGQLLGIAIHWNKGGPMVVMQGATVTSALGIHGDIRCAEASPFRKVIVVTESGWAEACQELGVDISWTHRRGNLFVRGIRLDAESVGLTLHIGTVEFVVTGEASPCKRMDEQYLGLRAALMPNWRGGATCRVVSPGELHKGDLVDVLRA